MGNVLSSPPPPGQSYEIRLLENRKLGDFQDLNTKYVKARLWGHPPSSGLVGVSGNLGLLGVGVRSAWEVWESSGVGMGSYPWSVLPKQPGACWPVLRAGGAWADGTGSEPGFATY